MDVSLGHEKGKENLALTPASPGLCLVRSIHTCHGPLRFLPTMAHHRGDDLEDDFMPDETVAFSEDEGSVSLVGDQDDIGKLLSADEEEEGIESPMEQTKLLLDQKKRRRREKEKERKAKACPFQLRSHVPTRDPLRSNRRENLTKPRNQGVSLPWGRRRLP